MSLRKIVFGFHLGAGLIAGTFLAFMAGTGLLLAFAPQLIAFSERAVSKAPSAEGPRLGLGPLLARAMAEDPDGGISNVTLDRDPAAALRIGRGPDRDPLYLDCRTGAVLGNGSGTRSFLQRTERWHRRLGARRGGEAFAGAGALALSALALSGLWLSLPRLRRGVRGLARCGDARSAHASGGAWAAPLLLALGVTGAMMAFEWLAAPVFGADPGRPSRNAAGRGRPYLADAAPRPEPGNVHVSLDALEAAMGSRAPGWESLTLRIAADSGAPWKGSVQETRPPAFPSRTGFEMDPSSGAISGWRSAAGSRVGARWRARLPSLHTGRGFGWPGQAAMGLAALSLLFQVATAAAALFRRARRRGPPARSPNFSISEFGKAVAPIRSAEVTYRRG